MDSIIDSVNKSELKIMYKNKLCEFIPIKQCSLQNMPDTVQGKVLYIGDGEYNPAGWYQNITVDKVDIIYLPNCNLTFENVVHNSVS